VWQEVLDPAKTNHGVILGPQSHADYPRLEQGGGRDGSAEFRSMDVVIMRGARGGSVPTAI
jgi:hypothetical protein